MVASTVYPIGIYADGVYSNSPVAGDDDLFDLERIEVLRGPQGTLYDKNNRLFLEAILWISRTGSPWRDLPPEFGKWNTVFKNYRDQVKDDINSQHTLMNTCSDLRLHA